ncbi:MAG: LacI family DNA-binding transcriptional regulator [Planctomycetota bacterium]|jgi:DNA-binding LacI/PurR family transcriptional regulator|nr:LacI family DNA-binding transcriptional regulator [Planctomycetota bacterium]
MNKRVTLKSIAAHCGLSDRTVSEILNRKGKRYAKDTVARVDAAAQELGYLPNAQARAVANGRLNTIGLVVGHVQRDRSRVPAGTLHPDLLSGLTDAARAAGQQLVVGDLDEVAQASATPSFLQERQVDGIVLNAHLALPEPVLEALQRYRIPVVRINAASETDCVRVDDVQVGRLAVEHLLSQGHRRLAFVAKQLGEVDAHVSVADRLRGAQGAARAAGVSLKITDPDLLDQVDGVLEVAAAWRRDPERPDGLVMYDGDGALALTAALAMQGLHYQADYAMVLLGTGARWHWPRIAAVSLPWYEIGRQAIAMVLARGAGAGAQACVRVPGELRAFSEEQV